MTFHSSLSKFGLATVFAVAVAAAAHAQPASTGGGGQMAYPDSLPSGQVTIPSSTARDTGNMAYPASRGGIVTSGAPPSADTGSKKGTATKTAAAAAPSSTAPTPQGMAAARALAKTPSDQPVPYVDFAAPGKAAKAGTMHHAKMMAKKPAA